MNLALLACAGLALLFGVVRACGLLPSHREPRSADDPTPTYASVGSIRWGIVYPALGWTLLIPGCWTSPTASSAEDCPGQALAGASYALAGPDPLFGADDLGLSPGLVVAVVIASIPAFLLFKANFRRWILASIGAALLTWLLLKIGHVDPAARIAVGQGGASILVDTATALTVFAPLALGGGACAADLALRRIAAGNGVGGS